MVGFACIGLLMASACLSEAAIPMPERGICAHQGDNVNHPANTAEAMASAVAMGAQMVEFDIQDCKSGELFLWHDSQIKVPGGVQKRIRELTADEVRALRPFRRYPEKGLSTFEETMAVLPRTNLWINIHCYCSLKAAIGVARWLKAEDRLHQSFLTVSLAMGREIRKEVPGVKICNISRTSKSRTYWTPDENRRYAENTVTNGCEFLQLAVPWTAEYSDIVHRGGGKVAFFKSENPAELERLHAEGIDFVLTNNLGPMLERERELQAKPTKSVKASDYGFDPVDSTRFLKAAIESDAQVVVVDRREGPWFVSPLVFRCLHDKVIRFERGTEIVAKPGEYRSPKSNQSCVFTFWGGTNVTLSGYGAKISMNRDEYAASPYEHSEHRHCLNLRGVHNFRIEGLTFCESGGDGIFLGGMGAGERFKTCENVTLWDVACDRNYRQGMSVITAKGLLCEHCVFSNTRGTPPESGVDLEPNYAHEVLEDIVFRNCRFDNNKGRGIEFFIGKLDDTSKPVSARIENCTMTGNVNGFEYQQSRSGGAKLPVGGKVSLVGCTITGSSHGGILVIDKPRTSAELIFEGVKLVDCCTGSTNSPDVRVYNRMFDTPPPDGITLRDFSVTRSVERPWFSSGKIDYTSTGVGAIAGEASVTTGGKTEKVSLDDAWREAFAKLPPDGPTCPRAKPFDRRAVVTDPCPGEMRELEEVPLASGARVVFYVGESLKARFRMRQVKLNGKRPLDSRRFLVTEYTGSKCSYLVLPKGGDEREVVFTARKAGYHAFTVEAGKQALRIVAADVPVAVEIAGRPVRFGLTSKGMIHFFAPTDFSLFAGADSYEKAAVGLESPAGEVVWRHNPLVDWQRYQGRGGEGMWTLALRPPKGIHRTVSVDLTGVSPFLFLSKDRYWR